MTATHRRLLAAVALYGGSVERDALIELTWGARPPPSARTALHVHISALRKLAPGVLRTTATGYQLDHGACRLDRAELDQLSRRAGQAGDDGRWHDVMVAVEAALRLWRGPPFAELSETHEAALEIERLTVLQATLLQRQATALSRLERHEEAAATLRRLLALQPLWEQAWEQLIQTSYRTHGRAVALRAYEDAARTLGAELGIEPSATLRRLADSIRYEDVGEADSGPSPPPNNLPLLASSFVGRLLEIDILLEQLRAGRQVTVIGGPGVGKTRLALEVGRELLERATSVWFVSLSEARNWRDLVNAVVQAIGVRRNVGTASELANWLASHHGLLILDNCEHLKRPCAELVELVLSRPGELRILITSRAPIGSDGETKIALKPLEVQPWSAGSRGDKVVASASARLLVDRARQVDRTFHVTRESARHIAELCRLTDGIPLAIELAASWVRALSLEDIGEMLASAPAEPLASNKSGPRRSLAAALDWSLALLPPGDRQLLLAASIFDGPFSLHDLQAVCAPRSERGHLALAVARLLDASLLVPERRTTGTVRYRTLLPMREIVRRRLDRTDRWQSIRDRFVEHFLARARGHEQDVFRAIVDLESVDDEIDNIRAALEAGLQDGRADDVATAQLALDGYILNRYLAWEARDRLERLLPVITEPSSRARALTSAGSWAQVTGDLETSIGLLLDGLAAYEALGDDVGTARCLLSVAGVQSNRGEWAAGMEAARRAQRLLAGAGNPSARAMAAYYEGECMAFDGQWEEGSGRLKQAADLFRSAGEDGRASYALSTLTQVAVMSGRHEAASANHEEALRLARRSQSGYRLVRALAASAAHEARWGAPEQARSALHELEQLIEPPDTELVFEFLFPAAILMWRSRAWGILLRTLDVLERWMTTSGTGYPVPWRVAAGEWRRDAHRHIVGGAQAAADHIPPGADDPAALRPAVLRFLNDPMAQFPD